MIAGAGTGLGLGSGSSTAWPQVPGKLTQIKELNRVLGRALPALGLVASCILVLLAGACVPHATPGVPSGSLYFPTFVVSYRQGRPNHGDDVGCLRWRTQKMQVLDPNKTGLVVGASLGGWHLLWGHPRCRRSGTSAFGLRAVGAHDSCDVDSGPVRWDGSDHARRSDIGRGLRHRLSVRLDGIKYLPNRARAGR